MIMSRDVLILSSSYLPLNTVSFKRAYKMWAKSLSSDDYKVDVISEYENITLNVFGEEMNAPAILRIGHQQQINTNKKLFKAFNRINVWTRDEGSCQYCNKEIPISEMHWDHVIPRAHGGKTVWENIVCCCRSCNAKKADRELKECGLKLKRKPTAPYSDCTLYKSIHNRMRRTTNSFPHDSWKDYLNWYKD